MQPNRVTVIVCCFLASFRVVLPFPSNFKWKERVQNTAEHFPALETMTQEALCANVAAKNTNLGALLL